MLAQKDNFSSSLWYYIFYFLNVFINALKNDIFATIFPLKRAKMTILKITMDKTLTSMELDEISEVAMVRINVA